MSHDKDNVSNFLLILYVPASSPDHVSNFAELYFEEVVSSIASKYKMMCTCGFKDKDSSYSHPHMIVNILNYMLHDSKHKRQSKNISS